MEVAARGDGALVSELSLDQGKGLALAREFRRVRVSEAVGVHALFDPGFPREPAQETADPGLADRPPVERAEDGPRRLWAPWTASARSNHWSMWWG